MYLLASQGAVLVNNVLFENTAGAYAGIILLDCSNVTLTHNTLSRNESFSGAGGLSNMGSILTTMTNTVLWQNSAAEIEDSTGTLVVSYCIDELKLTRQRATTLCGLSILVVTALCSLSLGAWGPVSDFALFANEAGPKRGLLSNLDHLASNWMLPIGGLLITVAAGWFMTRKTTESELVDERTPVWFNYGVWRFFIRFVAPLAVAAIIVAVIVSGKDFS